MLEFLWPWVFSLILLFPLLRVSIPQLNRKKTALTVPDIGAFEFSIDSTSAWRDPTRWARLLILFLAWTSLITALARPQWTGELTPLPTQGRDMFLAVDISGSMNTDDMFIEREKVTRLQALKHVVEPFILSRHGDRIGLILFGTRAYVYVPLTFDVETVNALLQEASGGIAGGQTAIGDTIGLAVKRLIERPIDHRILILMTDGSHNEGVLSPEEATRLAEDSNVRIHTIGIGADSSSQLGLGRRTFRFRGPPMNTKALEEISEKTGGLFFRANDTQGLERIYSHIATLEPIDQDPEMLRPVKSLFHWPLIVSLVLFAIAWWVRR